MVVGCVGDVVVALHWAAAPVCIHREQEEWLGADSHGSQQAEMTAFCMATLRAIQCYKRPVGGLLSDSLTTVMGACGLWAFPDTDVLASSCRSLAQAASSLDVLPSDRIIHTSAHVGCPWNELADGLAKWATSSDHRRTSALALRPGTG